MLTEGFELTLIGMSGVFLFLLLLIASMYAQAAIFKYFGGADKPEQSSVDAGDEALVAAAIAVKLKNG